MNGLASIGFDQYPVDASTVYRTLDSLEAESSLGPPRRVYRITRQGEELLRTWVSQLRATDRVLHRFLEEYDKSVDG
jgi:DNA-binding PadR family transcriptional regulator